MLMTRFYLLALFVLLPCTSNAQAASPSQAQQAIAQAQHAQLQAAQSGHEWTTISPLIEQAQQALDAGLYDNAVALARTSTQHSKLALEQAQREKTNWRLNLPK